MNKAYLGLGTHVGDREEYLKKACKLINDNTKINIINASKVYETKAWGYTDQDDFLNMCLEIQTILTPKELLKVCQEVEQALIRVRTIRWGPRTIDVDILFYNDEIINEENLTVPHPRIKERAFVLIPLLDLNEELMIDDKYLAYYLSCLSKNERDEVKEYNFAY